MREIILKLCEKDYLTIAQIGQLLDRDAYNLQSRFIRDMVKKQELILRHAELNHPQQAYKTNPNKRSSDEQSVR